jgi:CubicO group peptidase (beta-lactamase class C family)
MKTFWTRTIAATLLGATLAATSTPAGAWTGLTAFDAGRFKSNLTGELVEKSVGAAFAIYRNGAEQEVDWRGYAVKPSHPMLPETRFNLMGMSKTITAVAVMKALDIAQARGEHVSIHSPIAPYLPPSWARGRDVWRMTFRDLLRHESGLRAVGPGDPDRYGNLRATIARGAVTGPLGLPAYGRYAYCNCNFALMRVLIPRLLAEQDGFSDPFFLDELTGMGDEVALAYVDFVRERLLAPLGIDATVGRSGPAPYTRYYNYANPLIYMPADPMGLDAVRRAGAGHWYMSVRELAIFLARLRMGHIISPGSFQLMTTHELGLYRVGDAATAEHGGDYLTHNGFMSHGNPAPNDANNAGAHAAWMMFPNGVTAVLFHNADQTSLDDPMWILKRAFEGAFVSPF